MLNRDLLNRIDKIIADNHLERKTKKQHILKSVEPLLLNDLSFSIEQSGKSITKPKLDPTFIETLFKIIDDRGLKDSDIYNKVGIDRKTFSKIRNNTIKISKNNAIALCLGLELDINTTEELLSKAGYALSKSSMRDAIIRECITDGIVDIRSIDEYLIHYEQKTIMKYN